MGSYFSQIPPFDLNVGMPLSSETPAPVSATHCLCSTINAATSLYKASVSTFLLTKNHSSVFLYFLL